MGCHARCFSSSEALKEARRSGVRPARGCRSEGGMGVGGEPRRRYAVGAGGRARDKSATVGAPGNSSAVCRCSVLGGPQVVMAMGLAPRAPLENCAARTHPRRRHQLCVHEPHMIRWCTQWAGRPAGAAGKAMPPCRKACGVHSETAPLPPSPCAQAAQRPLLLMAVRPRHWALALPI
jgi:hypothetical protein